MSINLSKVNWVNVAGIVIDIAASLLPEIQDYVVKAISGDDVSDHWVRERIPKDLQTVTQDKILTEQRRAQGLPV